jgi:hypothetical protein
MRVSDVAAPNKVHRWIAALNFQNNYSYGFAHMQTFKHAQPILGVS